MSVWQITRSSQTTPCRVGSGFIRSCSIMPLDATLSIPISVQFHQRISASRHRLIPHRHEMIRQHVLTAIVIPALFNRPYPATRPLHLAAYRVMSCVGRRWQTHCTSPWDLKLSFLIGMLGHGFDQLPACHLAVSAMVGIRHAGP